jgi:DNA-directed RNA polymerase subunit alpha
MDFKGLIMPRSLQCETDTRTDTFARFRAEPFERGFAVTIGNSLRRILLSSIQGVAITAIRIDGITHEYESLAGCKEDISDIILNLKQMRIRLAGGVNETNMFIDVAGPKRVTAADFEPNEVVEILNPDALIASLDTDGELRMEIHLALGHGYVPALKEVDEADEIGIIPLDADYSPILNVTYSVEDARVGQRTDYDRLTLEVATDGSVAAEDCVSCAARILRDHLTMFIRAQDDQAAVGETEEGAPEVSPLEDLREKLDRSIEELELSVRSFNCLEAAGIKTIRDLVQKGESEMLKFRNFGRKSLSEIKSILKEMGLNFSTKIGEDGLPVAPKELRE